MQKMRLFQIIIQTLLFIFAVDLKLAKSQIANQSDEKCPEGYFLHSDELCNSKIKKHCLIKTQANSNTAKNSAIRVKKLECPDGSVMIENKCRKIFCTLGEYYKGICLQPVCPQGLVWRGKRCQKPEYLTTKIEVDNVIINEVIGTPIAVASSHVNKVVDHASTTGKPYYTDRLFPLTITTREPQYSIPSTTIKNNITNSPYTGGCCKVFTPRICKLYSNKWLCFNRKYERCDSNFCISPVIYLKAPEIKYVPPLLIMPPNPKLVACENNNCPNNSDVIDCSGCSSFRSATCSPHCYRYVCPDDSCMFMDLYEYCSNYSGRDGCSPVDGCLWKWCQI